MLKTNILIKVCELWSCNKSCTTDILYYNLAKNAEHTVLRLSPYHYELNPVELTWATVKWFMKRENTTFKIDEVRLILNTAIERLTVGNGKNVIQHVI